MKIPRLYATLALGLSLFLSPGLLHAQTISFKPAAKFLYPGAVNTLANAIDDEGDVVGIYQQVTFGDANGFERFADGHFSAPIIYPGAVQTVPTAINNGGTIAGWYQDSAGGGHGFFLTNGVYTSFDHPNAFFTTLIYGINDAGDFVGTYTTSDGKFHNFASVGGQFSEITIPGSTYIEAHDINNNGDIAGWYNTTETTNGFRLQGDGTLRYPIKPPADFSSNLYGTNDTKASVGQANGTLGLYYGGGNSYLSYTFPGLTFNQFTGINQRGLICGYGSDSVAHVGYGYLVRRVITASPEPR